MSIAVSIKINMLNLSMKIKYMESIQYELIILDYMIIYLIFRLNQSSGRLMIPGTEGSVM